MGPSLRVRKEVDYGPMPAAALRARPFKATKPAAKKAKKVDPAAGGNLAGAKVISPSDKTAVLASSGAEEDSEFVAPPVTDVVEDEEEDDYVPTSNSKKKRKRISGGTTRKKRNDGESPFPNHDRPTPEECAEVKRLLESVHGVSIRPEVVVVDNEVSGCGEVPNVMDALLRTVLSANTSNSNSAKAFQGLVARFGLVPKSEGTQLKRPKHYDATLEGSVDWNAVRKQPVEELYNAIKMGGLAKTKSETIKSVLDSVWEDGKKSRLKKREHEAALSSQEEAEAIATEITEDIVNKIVAEVEGSDSELSDPEDSDNEGELTLDHLHTWSNADIKKKLTSYKGVGHKTTACILLFCLKRDAFPVDTHVHRLTQYLGWIPEKANRDQAYFHLDTKIPEELKYSLHNLLIRHGRMCPHCKAGPEKASPKTKAEGKTPEKASPKVKTEDNTPENIEDASADDDEFTPVKKKAKKSPKTPKAPKTPKIKKEKVETAEDGTIIKTKRTKKVWVGNGMMKETVIEIDTDDEGGEVEAIECVLEHLLKRVRKARLPTKIKVKKEDADEEVEEGVLDDDVMGDVVTEEQVKDTNVGVIFDAIKAAGAVEVKVKIEEVDEETDIDSDVKSDKDDDDYVE